MASYIDPLVYKDITEMMKGTLQKRVEKGTKVFEVKTIDSNFLFGWIGWSMPHNQYTFGSPGRAAMTAATLTSLTRFINKLAKLHPYEC